MLVVILLHAMVSGISPLVTVVDARMFGAATTDE